MARYKIKPEYRKQLEKVLNEWLTKTDFSSWAELLEFYRVNNIGRDTARRARWDAFWNMPSDKRLTWLDSIRDSGVDVHDENIDAVLRAIIK